MPFYLQELFSIFLRVPLLLGIENENDSCEENRWNYFLNIRFSLNIGMRFQFENNKICL